MHESSNAVLPATPESNQTDTSDSEPGSANPLVAKVAIAVPLSRSFDYLPVGDIKLYKPGCRVAVSFGRTRKVGVVIETGKSTLAQSKLKPVIELLDREPPLSKDIVDLIQWAASYYHHPIGEVFATALPIMLRKGSTAELERPCAYSVTEAGRTAEVKRAPVQAALLDFLCNSDTAMSAAECRLFDSRWSATIKPLIKKGLVEKVWQQYTPGVTPSAVTLNEEQQHASEKLHANLNRFYCALIDGITGSGKTEVYLDVARSVIKAGKQVLVLLPEIGLTPQLVARFRTALACQVEVLHSGLNDTERMLAWHAAADGSAHVLIGTRSAVFTPMPKLGFIVIDEEHDGSLKQQDGFRYQARDLALVRAGKAKIPVAMGSATPSLESLYNAEKGLYETLFLRSRAAGAVLPDMLLVDSRGGEVENGLSRRLLSMMQKVLERGEQAMVFINRRGYSPVLMCESCTTIADCDQCDAHMTVHAHSGKLRCHHCGAERIVPVVCSACESTDLINVGMGTERIDETLQEKFPDYKVLRIDRDSTRRKGELQKHLATAASGEAQILVGTQLLAKGHNFPNVTLVGVVDADRGLFGADFRSVEQMGQLILQVAGRAGRADKPGTVLVQSRNPEHPLLQLLMQEGYTPFARHLLDERKIASWPPYVHVALLRAEAPAKDAARQYLSEVKRMVTRFTNAHPDIQSQVSVLGPAHAPMERLAGRYRAQLLVISNVRKPLHELLGWLRPGLENWPGSRKVKWSLDVDPYDML